jgi:RNA polymerase sigma-70 factor (ECF subfamily)
MTADDARLGDDRITRWVQTHARAVRGYVLGLVRRHDVADDIVQEVFQRAWQARDQYQEHGRERAYLLRIADRLVVDRSRRRREIALDDDAWQELEPAAGDLPPPDELARWETNDELAAALDRLTPAQRRVLLLRFFGDLTFEEIAATLECPLSTALSHGRRGLLALRQLLTAKT